MALRWFGGLAAAAVALVPQAARPDTLTPQMRRDDPRLEQRVTVGPAHMWVGEILERLTKDTGVILTPGVRDGAADQQLYVAVRDVKLGDLMDALWSLESYRGAAWHWEREGDAGAYRYVLLRSLAAQQLAGRLANRAQDAFEQAAAIMEQAVRGSPEDRARLVQQNPALAASVNDARTRGGFGVFLDTLPLNVRQELLSGARRQILVPVTALSDASRVWVKRTWDESGMFVIRPDGSRAPAPDPKTVGFENWRPDPSSLTPVLGITIDGTGQAYAGGLPLQRMLHREFDSLWVLPEDAASSSLEGKKVAAPKDPAAAGKPEGDYPLDERARQLAVAAPLNLLARFPAEQRLAADPRQPYGMTVGEYLKKCDGLQHKWRRGILLLANPAWFYDEPLTVPWRIVKDLRKAAPPGDRLPIEKIGEAAAQLTPQQLRTLRREFPVMIVAAEWHVVFAAMGRSPVLRAALTSSRGAPIASLMGALPMPPTIRDPASVLGRARTVRLMDQLVAGMRYLDLSALDADGKPVLHRRIVHQPRTVPDSGSDAAPANPH